MCVLFQYVFCHDCLEAYHDGNCDNAQNTLAAAASANVSMSMFFLAIVSSFIQLIYTHS